MLPVLHKNVGRVIVSYLWIAWLWAGAIAQAGQPRSQPVRVSPGTAENPKVDAKLLAGTHVVVHAIISKTGEVRGVEFIRGNADLMPDIRKALMTWKYKPYVYRGHPVEVETTIYINFDPLTGG